MAEIQKMQIDLQSEANYYEIQMAKEKFNFYLGNLQKYEPKVLDIKYPEPQLSDTNAASYPKLKASELNVTRQKLNWKKEKSVLLPGLNLNYYNMTIIGWQKVDNIDTYFGPSTRFSNFTVGIHLPLFFWGQSATIKSSKLMYKKSMTDFALAKFEYNAELNIALSDLEKQNKIVEHYEQTGLEQAKILVNNANNQYNQGNIGYLEWAYLINQSIQLNNDYLDAINNYNNSIIQFELLTPKTN
jgi:cobalt-zinc-cadmium resistance protein CzcA